MDKYIVIVKRPEGDQTARFVMTRQCRFDPANVAQENLYYDIRHGRFADTGCFDYSGEPTFIIIPREFIFV